MCMCLSLFFCIEEAAMCTTSGYYVPLNPDSCLKSCCTIDSKGDCNSCFV